MKILALGDCNTMGIKEQYHNSYPEKLAKAFSAEVVNLGCTMATTREGIQLFNTVKTQNFDMLLISFGLTDSWETFKGAPYVLYYPDNICRSILRKIVKKYKKIGNRLFFKKIFGLTHVVPPQEYIKNLNFIIKNSNAKVIFLLETLPKKEIDRNVSIKKYNSLLKTIKDSRLKIVELYDFFNYRGEFFQDKTHLNEEGYNYITEKIYSLIEK